MVPFLLFFFFHEKKKKKKKKAGGRKEEGENTYFVPSRNLMHLIIVFVLSH